MMEPKKAKTKPKLMIVMYLKGSGYFKMGRKFSSRCFLDGNSVILPTNTTSIKNAIKEAERILTTSDNYETYQIYSEEAFGKGIIPPLVDKEMNYGIDGTDIKPTAKETVSS